jgi:hypothetical protein
MPLSHPFNDVASEAPAGHQRMNGLRHVTEGGRMDIVRERSREGGEGGGSEARVLVGSSKRS